MNLREIVKKHLDENVDDAIAIMHGNVVKIDGVETKYIDSYGGEGQGEEYWGVYSFKRDEETVYVKAHGTYASYCGSEYEGWYFVTPREQTITVYE